MRRKSSTCLGKISKAPLTEYDSRWEAEDHAAYLAQTLGGSWVPYPCGRCRQWHLAPRDRQTPSTPCPVCVSSEGVEKASYDTEEDAERRAAILQREDGTTLRVYLCPHGYGWHLTKSGAECWW